MALALLPSHPTAASTDTADLSLIAGSTPAATTN